MNIFDQKNTSFNIHPAFLIFIVLFLAALAVTRNQKKEPVPAAPAAKETVKKEEKVISDAPPPINIYNLPRGTYQVIGAKDLGSASPDGSAHTFIYTVLAASAFPDRVEFKVLAIEPAAVGPVHRRGSFITVVAPGQIQVQTTK